MQIFHLSKLQNFNRNAAHLLSTDIIATPFSPIDCAYSLIISLLMSVLILDVPFGYVTHNDTFGLIIDFI
jgi:hypothetical protein